MALQHLRSSTANKRPVPGNMSDGQLGINTNDGSPGLFFKNNNNALVKVGPVHVGTTAPNASPAGGGTAGNSVGEQWLDTSGGTYVLKVWDGSTWRSESSIFSDAVTSRKQGNVNDLGYKIDNGSWAQPNLIGHYYTGSVDAASIRVPSSTLSTSSALYLDNNGVFQVIGTGSSTRLIIDSSGRLGLGTSSPAKKLEVQDGDIQVYNVNSAFNTLSSYGITFRSINPAGQDRGTIAEIKTYTGGANDNDFGLQFRTQASTASGVTTKVILTPAGLLETQDSGIQVRNSLTLAEGALSPHGLTFRNANSLGQDRGTIAAIKPYLGTAGDNDFGLQFQTQATTAGGVTTKVILTPAGLLETQDNSVQVRNSLTLAQGALSPHGLTFRCTNNVGQDRGVVAAIKPYLSTSNDNDFGLQFQTQATTASGVTTKMTLDPSGRLLVGLASGTPSTTVFGTAVAPVFYHSRDTSSSAVAQLYGNAGEFRIIGNGNAQNTYNSYGAISDQSLKTNISDAGSQWDDIKGITVRKFKLISTDTVQIGVVAQECELVSPGLVEDTVLEQEDGTTSTVKAVKYSVLYMKAVKALQEAMERIEQLEQRLAAAGI
jgi:hypothetical protein